MIQLNKIACMDCIEYLQRLPNNSVDLVVTDPPYNVSQVKNMMWKGRVVRKNFGDWDFGFSPEPVMKELKRILKKNGQIYVFCSTPQIPEYMDIFNNGWFFRNLIVWSKTNPVPRMSKTNWLFANEYIVYAINEKVKLNKITFNFPSQMEMKNLMITPTLQGKERIKRTGCGAFHPTQKPLSVLKRLISASSEPGDVVLDPFMGVGSTAVAAQELGRDFLGCEIDPQYAKVARQRLSGQNQKKYPFDVTKG